MTDDVQLGGRLQHFLPYWHSICRDKRILSMIKGVHFDFTSPHQTKFPKQIPTSTEGKKFMIAKIRELLENGLIK